MVAIVAVVKNKEVCVDCVTLSLNMQLETSRLVLRRWTEADAPHLFRYAQDPAVGPIAGWPPHQSEEESLGVIRQVFTGLECYALCLKPGLEPVGTIELILCGQTRLTERADECELGFWLGHPFWGRGYMPEAVRRILRHAFEDLGMSTIWCAYYEGNLPSRRVQEKCGFRYHSTQAQCPVPLLNTIRTAHINRLSRQDWAAMQD